MGEVGSCSVFRALLNKSSMQLSADGWGCAPCLLVVWTEAIQSGVYRLYGSANGDLQEGLCQHTPPRTAAAVPVAGRCQPTPPQESLRH